MVLLLIEIVVRPWSGYAIPGSQVFVRQLTMWVALLGAALAARDGRLLGRDRQPASRARAAIL